MEADENCSDWFVTETVTLICGIVTVCVGRAGRAKQTLAVRGERLIGGDCRLGVAQHLIGLGIDGQDALLFGLSGNARRRVRNICLTFGWLMVIFGVGAEGAAVVQSERSTPAADAPAP